MSATRDKTQQIAFVYSNLYQIYQKSKHNPQNTPKGFESSVVIKSGDVKAESAQPINVREFTPPEILAKRIEQANVRKEMATRNTAVDDLKNNLKTLNDLHGKLRFMLKELEELSREDKE